MPARKYVRPVEKVGLNFTAAERKATLKDVAFLDDDYEQELRDTPADQAIEFTLGDWDYLGGEISNEAEAADDLKRKQRLINIFTRIEKLLAAYYTDEEPERRGPGTRMRSRTDEGRELGIFQNPKLAQGRAGHGD